MAPQPSDWPPLAELQGTFRTEHEKIQQQQAARQKAVIRNFDAALDRLEKERVQQGDLAAALVIRNERNKLRTAIAPDPEPAKVARTPEWISKDATYTASSDYKGKPARPCLLSGEGRLYRHGLPGPYSFCTKNQKDPYIIIDLGKQKTITKIIIANRVSRYDPGLTIRASELTLWASQIDSFRIGPPIWKAPQPQAQWIVALEKPVTARYLKLGLPGNNRYLHLRHVKVFGYED